MPFKGTAFVTGGAKRIGRAIVLALAESGYDIALHYYTSKEDAETTAERVRLLGRKCELFGTDLADTEGLDALVQSVVRHFPDCRVLVNNASIFERATLKETDIELLSRTMAINLHAPVLLSRAFAQYCKQGVIVNLVDSHVTQYHGAFFAYLLSKKTLAAFTQMAARELGPDIRVNAVCPGVALPGEEFAGYVKSKEPTLPLKQIATSEDVAKAVLTCIRETYMTGQCVFVDGGEHLL
ncbi:MAG: short chain dehydrogenase [Rickettsiales bacterium]|jgi:NAD(P)-dependent dehydrogenase (short-subunit alcohol dehydrogenase family)|nr:short chain dehydrogenase [Rickettsiales bacterium]